ncbi:hypothetical protein OH77DRAFT_1425688 [Trametes cingulata]|nr:hypothetical protein OH77DRAFT_1425688 [Trametes cingulata]
MAHEADDVQTNQDIRRLSVSLGSMGVSKPTRGRLSPDEIATIKDAHFDVPVVVDTYEIVLTDEERAMAVPPDLRRRVGGTRYTWALYTADSVPDPRIGVKGDIWVDSTPASRRIYYQGDRNAWDICGWNSDSNSKANPQTVDKTSLKTLAIYHPWLQHRRLEFDGVGLKWGIVDRRWSLYMDRLNKQVKAAGWPKYAEIPLYRVATHLCTAAPPSPRRIVVPCASQTDAQVRSDPPDPGPSQPTILPVLRFESFSWAKKAFPPPGLASPNSSFRFSQTSSAAQAPIDVPMKTEEEEESVVLEQLKRARDSASASPAPEQGLKRAKVDEPRTTPLAMSISPAPNSPMSQPSLFFGPAAALRLSGATRSNPPDETSTDIAGFLGTLSIPLTHCEPTLRDLGISSMAYLESFAAAPESLLSQFTAKLQERGLKFMDALILRNGLSTLRRQDGMNDRPATSPESVEAFLSALRPSMVHHAPIFRELGVETIHLPILAKLDTASYAEFEQTLRAKGLPWADCFLIKVALKTRLPV